MASIKIQLALSALCAALAAACSPNTPSPTTTTPATPMQTAPYAFTGQVLQAGTANGIASATITLVSPSGVPSATATDASGAFSFSGLADSGTYTLQADAAGYVSSSAAIAVPVVPVPSFTIKLLPLSAVPPTAVSTLSVSGNAALNAVGQTSQLTATVTHPDGTTANVSSIANWTSSNPAVATVSNAGLVTAYSAGVTLITATLPNLSGSLAVSVSF